MKRRTLIIILGAVLIAAVVGVIVWQVRLRAQPAEPLRSAVVERGTIRVVVSASGNIGPLARTSLSFETPGQVAQVMVVEGDPVVAGQALALLDTSQLELQVQQAEASLQQAEAQLTQLQEGPQPAQVAAAEANLRAAQARVDAAAANRDQVRDSVTASQIADAQTQLASAQLQERQAQEQYNTLVRFLGDSTNEDDVKRIQEAGLRLLNARKQTEAAQATLDRLSTGADPESLRAAQANLAAAEAQRDGSQAQLDLLNAGTAPEQIAGAQAQVDQARAALKLAQLTLARATLSAPFDGEVAAVNAKAGEMTSSALPALELLDTSRFRLTVSVDEIDVGQLVVGQTAEITLDAFEGITLTGTVERIAPVARIESGVISYDVLIGLEPGDVPVRADMTANASIMIEELKDVLILPTSIIRVDPLSGQTYVSRQVDKGRYERVDVTLGVRYQGQVEVLSGLSEGETVYWVEEQSGPFGASFGNPS